MFPGQFFAAISVLLIVCLCAGAASSQDTPDTDLTTVSRFQRTVQYLQGASAEDRAVFAAVALAELIEVYMAEADLARAPAAEQASAVRGKLLGWSLAVDQYADQLLLVLDDVEQGFPVSLRPDPKGPVTATVADRPVILGHPRADQQAAYELRVLNDFCTKRDCKPVTVAVDEPAPIPASQMRVKTLWAFTESGPVCSGNSIEVHFHSRQNLAILRGLCEELLQELETLAMHLAWQIRHGVAIEWGGLVVSATPRNPEHLVRLNSAGDSVLATLPLLHDSAQLLADSRPWLHSRASGSKPAVLRLDAADYGWVVPGD